MFSGSLLSTAALAAAAASSVMSPSKCGKVKVTSTRYRNDPYAVRVTPKTPMMQAPLLTSDLLQQLPQQPVAAPLASPTRTAAPEPKQHWALIQFKHERAYYMAPFRINVGDHVVVEADRGENYGVVSEITCEKPAFNVPSSVVRRVTEFDASVKANYTEREPSTSVSIQRLAESLGLGIKVVDTEYQLDGNKLTVFFTSRVFVDFRKLQRSLFREHRCRIWLVNTNEIRADVPRLL